MTTFENAKYFQRLEIQFSQHASSGTNLYCYSLLYLMSALANTHLLTVSLAHVHKRHLPDFMLGRDCESAFASATCTSHFQWRPHPDSR